MLKPLSLVALAAFALSACGGDQKPQVQASFAPGEETKLLDRVATRIEMDGRIGSLTGLKFRKAEISDAFLRGKVFNTGPSASYCVRMEVESVFGAGVNYYALVDITEQRADLHKVEIQFFDVISPPPCSEKPLHDFPKLMELREKRRAGYAAHRPAEKPMP